MPDHHLESRARTGLVERVLCDLDPYCLLEMGAPSDQFQPLAALIAARWKDGMTLETLATEIEAVWNSEFGPDSKAAETAHVIAERLIAAGAHRA